MFRGDRYPGGRRGRVASAVLAGAILLSACGGGDAKADSDAVKPEKIVLINPANFSLKDGSTVSVLSERGLDIDESAFSEAKIKQSAAKVQKFAETVGTVQINIGKPGSTDILPVKLDLSKPPVGSHGFIVAKTPQHAYGIAAQAESQTGLDLKGVSPDSLYALTAFEIGAKDRTTYWAPYPGKTTNRYGKDLPADDFNREVEACNSFLNVAVSQETRMQLESQIGAQEAQGTIDFLLQLGHEAVCNSYALAATAQDAALSYEDYLLMADAAQLGGDASSGFTIPYVTFSAEQVAAFTA